MHMCAATFSLLSLLPLPPDDLPAGEAVGGEHVVGGDSDEHLVGEVGEEHVVAVSIVCTGGELLQGILL